jgi:hypothetical protein
MYLRFEAEIKVCITRVFVFLASLSCMSIIRSYIVIW